MPFFSFLNKLLVRLKKSCNCRDIIRIARLQAIKKCQVEERAGRLQTFCRKGAHTFVRPQPNRSTKPSQIGELSSPQFIDKISLWLKLQDGFTRTMYYWEVRRQGVWTSSDPGSAKERPRSRMRTVLHRGSFMYQYPNKVTITKLEPKPSTSMTK